MAEPNKKPSTQELLFRLRASRRNRPVMPSPQIVNEPDAVNETLRASGALQRQEAARRDIEFRQQQQEREQQAQTARRNNYRARKRVEREQAQQQGQQMFSFPVEWMTDEQVDAAIAQEQRDAQFRANQPQLRQGTDWSKYTPEARHAMGYYTQEEREQAARMNDMRSSTFFGNVMPNFGRQAAYNNPGAEMDAFRGTATYFPNAVVTGMGFNLPSATTAAASGLRTGWQTAKVAGANLGQRAVSATTTAARQAAPIVTNPRWAATTAAVATPMVAAASDGAEQSGGFWNWVGNHPMESLLIGTIAYKGGRGLWNRRGKLRIPAEPTEGRPARFTEAAPERGEGTWSYNPAEYPPHMRREPMLEDYQIRVEQPSQPRPAAFAEAEPPMPTGLRPKEKGKAAQWDAQNQAHQEWKARRAQYDADNAELNRQWDEYEGPTRYDDAQFQAAHDEWSRTAQSDYDAAMQRHQADVADYNAEQARLDQEYNDATAGYNQRKAANEKAWQTYHESDPYKQWLERKNGVLNFRTKAWNGVKNSWYGVKNNWYWAVPAGIVGYNWLTGGYSDQQGNPTNNPNGDNTPNDSTTTLPAGFRPIKGINDSGQVVVQSASGRPDSIIQIEPLTRNRFGRGESQDQ